MDEAHVAPGGANVRILHATVAGHAINISLQGGPEASQDDYTLAEAIVASIRPTGTQTDAVEDPGPSAQPVDCGTSDAIDLTKEPNYSANYLTRWTTSDGCDVRLDVAMTRSSACFDGVEEILLGWPLGTSSSHHEYRLYIRDPSGVSGVDSASRFDPDATLPTDAVDSGLRQAGAELWIEGDSGVAIWLVTADGVEEWPQETPVVGCD
jgi:hypothetical protein